MSASDRDILTIRIKPEDWTLFDWAATVQGKTRAAFILDAARSAAQEALINIAVGGEAHADLVARLEARPSPSRRLKLTMQCKAPWDRS